WAHARVHGLVFMHARDPALWRGLPLASGLIRIAARPLSARRLIEMYEATQALLPLGHAWPYSEMACHVVRGIDGGEAVLPPALGALHQQAAALEADDPPAAGWALLHAAALLLHARRHREVCDVVARARVLADACALERLQRDLLLYEMRSLEALG